MAGTKTYQNAESHDRLRRIAKELLNHGVPLPGHGGSLSVEALQLLYQRASDPESAADALKLLHELQTYQVELDLLYEQLQANEQDINEELEHYRSLYDQAPAAYLNVAIDGKIIEANQAAGLLFNETTADLTDIALRALLAPGQEPAINPLFKPFAEQGSAQALVKLRDRRPVAIHAKSSATGDSILMILTETTAPTTTS